MVDETAGQDDEVALFSAGQSQSLITAFTDVRFRTVTTNRAAPALYVLILLAAAGFYVGAAVFAFHVAVWAGVLWLLLVGPVLCGCFVLVMRMAIELLLAVLVMMEQLNETAEVVLDIAELTTGLSLKAELIPSLPSFVRHVRARRTYGQPRTRLVRRDGSELEQSDLVSDQS